MVRRKSALMDKTTHQSCDCTNHRCFQRRYQQSRHDLVEIVRESGREHDRFHE